VNFAIEQLVEIAAERLGISAIDFRRRNMVKQGSTTVTGQLLDGHTVSLTQALDSALWKTDYEMKLAKCSRGKSDGDELYGIGLAMSYRGMSLGGEGTDFNTAMINVQQDGSILLEAGVHENGQGSESAMILLLASELGVKKERIRYRQSSTSVIPDGGTTVASRATLMGGGAVVNTARALKRQMAEALAPKLACKPDEIRFENEHLIAPEPGNVLEFDAAVREMFRLQQHPHAVDTFRAPRVTWDEETGQGNAYFTWVYGCQAVELTVNRKTGKVTLLNAVAAHDVGRAVNPAMLLGQFYGGMAMSTGYALHEEVRMEEGKILNTNFDHYRIPRSTDMPEMSGIVIENPDPLSPSGAKGIGEPANELLAPAIANAIYHATGRRYTRLPIRVEALP
jgi:CO/xanthine dehydrogenase Mo-binding subunit